MAALLYLPFALAAGLAAHVITAAIGDVLRNPPPRRSPVLPDGSAS